MIKVDTGFKYRLLYLMKEKSMNYNKLAKLLDVEPQTIKYWINGVKAPTSTKYISKLCEVFNVKASWLISGCNIFT